MVRIRSTDEIIKSTLDFYRTAQQELDTKPGSVARDILVDGPATQLSRLYEELARIRSSQSLRLSLGTDLDRLGQNFGAVRKQGSRSTGTGIATFNTIDADIPINSGDIVSANNGATFTVTTGVTVSVNNLNIYRATASKYQSDLDFVGITDKYAVEIQMQSTATGTLGNISKYSLSSITTSGVSNIMNTSSFSGGSQSEDDAAFRNRVLSVFSGANTGTATGYYNTIKNDSAVLDAIVITPGDTLMTRDGTQVNVAEDGTRTIVSDGTGGKVDIYVYGLRIVEILDSFIYRDKSNKNDPTDPSNDFALGQITADVNKTVTRKRIDDLVNGELPAQPVNDIIQVSGSSSGSNFLEKTVDSLGRITGNYELIRDTGAYGSSPWGFDTLHFIDDRIRDFYEDLSKGRFNGQDSLTYSDVLEISSSTQKLQVLNENSKVSSADRTSIQLSHYPVSGVSRVFNFTTGERYVVVSQNPDGTGSLNNNGRIVISGNTLPAVSDTLQVDYTWVFSYDPNFDFDNRINGTNPRNVVDSIDWGFSNAVRRESAIVAASGSQLTVSVTHSITSVVSVNTYVQESSSVQSIQGRLAVVVSNTVASVISVVSSTNAAEFFDTSKNDGTFSGLTIFLPTDTIAIAGDTVVVIYNDSDVYTVDGLSGSFDSNLITLSSNAGIVGGTLVEVNYIANIKTLLPTTLIPALPAVRSANGFNTTVATGTGTQPTTHVFSSVDVIDQNLRMAPSRLQLTIAGTISAGVITVSGTTFTGVFDAVYTVGTAGLQFDLAATIRTALGLNSTTTVPSNVNIVRITSVEKVTTSSALDVLSVDHAYDIKGYEIKDNSFVKSEAVNNSELSATQFVLPSTADNQDNIPNTGDRLRITFYLSKTTDTESVSFSKAGSLYTNKIFALIDTVSISSGFTSGASQTATLTIANQNQPAAGTRYTAVYDYLAPKANERITIRYNQNKLIADSTVAIEAARPVSADVLVKSATPILVDATLAVVVQNSYTNASTVVQQNVRDAITAALNATQLGTTVDASDLVQSAYTVSGVDRVRVMYFNIDGEVGSALSIEAEKNEYIQANNITVNIETR